MAPFYPSPIVVQPAGDPYADYKAGRKTLEEVNAEYARLWPRCEAHGERTSALWHDKPVCLKCAQSLFKPRGNSIG